MNPEQRQFLKALLNFICVICGLIVMACGFWEGQHDKDWAQGTFNEVLGFAIIASGRQDR